MRSVYKHTFTVLSALAYFIAGSHKSAPYSLKSLELKPNIQSMNEVTQLPPWINTIAKTNNRSLSKSLSYNALPNLACTEAAFDSRLGINLT